MRYSLEIQSIEGKNKSFFPSWVLQTLYPERDLFFGALLPLPVNLTKVCQRSKKVAKSALVFLLSPVSETFFSLSHTQIESFSFPHFLTLTHTLSKVDDKLPFKSPRKRAKNREKARFPLGGLSAAQLYDGSAHMIQTTDKRIESRVHFAQRKGRNTCIWALIEWVSSRCVCLYTYSQQMRLS